VLVAVLDDVALAELGPGVLGGAVGVTIATMHPAIPGFEGGPLLPVSMPEDGAHVAAIEQQYRRL
jgi:hypothetical protein